MSSTVPKRSLRLDESLESGRVILRALYVDGYVKFDPVDSLQEEMRDFSTQAVVAVQFPGMVYFGIATSELVCKRYREEWAITSSRQLATLTGHKSLHGQSVNSVGIGMG